MLAPNKKFEFSGLMTFRSNAAERERDQLGTNTSADCVLSFVEVSPQPLSISGARQALRQKSAKPSRRRLCLVTTSPPERHIRAWEQCGQASTPVESGSPSHHFTKAWTSLGSRSNLNFGDGCALSHACAWGAEMIDGRLVVWPCLLLMLHQAKKGSQLSRWLRITCADDGKHLVHFLQRAAHNMLPSH